MEAKGTFPGDAGRSEPAKDQLELEAEKWFNEDRLERFAVCLERSPFLWRADHRRCKARSVLGMAYTKLLRTLGERVRRDSVRRTMALCTVFVSLLRDQLLSAANESWSKGEVPELALQRCPQWVRLANSYLQLMPAIFESLRSSGPSGETELQIVPTEPESQITPTEADRHLPPTEPEGQPSPTEAESHLPTTESQSQPSPIEEQSSIATNASAASQADDGDLEAQIDAHFIRRLCPSTKNGSTTSDQEGDIDLSPRKFASSTKNGSTTSDANNESEQEANIDTDLRKYASSTKNSTTSLANTGSDQEGNIDTDLRKFAPSTKNGSTTSLANTGVDQVGDIDMDLRKFASSTTDGSTTNANSGSDLEGDIDIDLRKFAIDAMGSLTVSNDNDFESDCELEDHSEVEPRKVDIDTTEIISKAACVNDVNADLKSEETITNASTTITVDGTNDNGSEVDNLDISMAPCFNVDYSNDSEKNAANVLVTPCVNDDSSELMTSCDDDGSCQKEAEANITDESTIPCDSIVKSHNEPEVNVTNESSVISTLTEKETEINTTNVPREQYSNDDVGDDALETKITNVLKAPIDDDNRDNNTLERNIVDVLEEPDLNNSILNNENETNINKALDELSSNDGDHAPKTEQPSTMDAQTDSSGDVPGLSDDHKTTMNSLCHALFRRWPKLNGNTKHWLRSHLKHLIQETGDTVDLSDEVSERNPKDITSDESNQKTGDVEHCISDSVVSDNKECKADDVVIEDEDLVIVGVSDNNKVDIRADQSERQTNDNIENLSKNKGENLDTEAKEKSIENIPGDNLKVDSSRDQTQLVQSVDTAVTDDVPNDAALQVGPYEGAGELIITNENIDMTGETEAHVESFQSELVQRRPSENVAVIDNALDEAIKAKEEFVCVYRVVPDPEPTTPSVDESIPKSEPSNIEGLQTEVTQNTELKILKELQEIDIGNIEMSIQFASDDEVATGKLDGIRNACGETKSYANITKVTNKSKACKNTKNLTKSKNNINGKIVLKNQRRRPRSYKSYLEDTNSDIYNVQSVNNPKRRNLNIRKGRKLSDTSQIPNNVSLGRKKGYKNKTRHKTNTESKNNTVVSNENIIKLSPQLTRIDHSQIRDPEINCIDDNTVVSKICDNSIVKGHKRLREDEDTAIKRSDDSSKGSKSTVEAHEINGQSINVQNVTTKSRKRQLRESSETKDASLDSGHGSNGMSCWSSNDITEETVENSKVDQSTFDPKLLMYPMVPMNKLDTKSGETNRTVKLNSISPHRTSLSNSSPRHSRSSSVSSSSTLGSPSSPSYLYCNKPAPKSVKRLRAMRKREELSDIKEVRQNNHSLLTAQVAPVSVRQDGPGITTGCGHDESLNVPSSTTSTEPGCSRCAAERLAANASEANAPQKHLRNSAAKARNMLLSLIKKRRYKIGAKTGTVGAKVHRKEYRRKGRRRTKVTVPKDDNEEHGLSEELDQNKQDNTASKNYSLVKVFVPVRQTNQNSMPPTSCDTQVISNNVNVTSVASNDLGNLEQIVHNLEKELSSSHDQQETTPINSFVTSRPCPLSKKILVTGKSGNTKQVQQSATADDFALSQDVRETLEISEPQNNSTLEEDWLATRDAATENKGKTNKISDHIQFEDDIDWDDFASDELAAASNESDSENIPDDSNLNSQKVLSVRDNLVKVLDELRMTATDQWLVNDATSAVLPTEDSLQPPKKKVSEVRAKRKRRSRRTSQDARSSLVNEVVVLDDSNYLIKNHEIDKSVASKTSAQRFRRNLQRNQEDLFDSVLNDDVTSITIDDDEPSTTSREQSASGASKTSAKKFSRSSLRTQKYVDVVDLTSIKIKDNEPSRKTLEKRSLKTSSKRFSKRSLLIQDCLSVTDLEEDVTTITNKDNEPSSKTCEQRPREAPSIRVREFGRNSPVTREYVSHSTRIKDVTATTVKDNEPSRKTREQRPIAASKIRVREFGRNSLLTCDDVSDTTLNKHVMSISPDDRVDLTEVHEQNINTNATKPKAKVIIKKSSIFPPAAPPPEKRFMLLLDGREPSTGQSQQKNKVAIKIGVKRKLVPSPLYNKNIPIPIKKGIMYAPLRPPINLEDSDPENCTYTDPIQVVEDNGPATQDAHVKAINARLDADCTLVKLKPETIIKSQESQAIRATSSDKRILKRKRKKPERHALTPEDLSRYILTPDVTAQKKPPANEQETPHFSDSDVECIKTVKSAKTVSPSLIVSGVQNQISTSLTKDISQAPSQCIPELADMCDPNSNMCESDVVQSSEDQFEKESSNDWCSPVILNVMSLATSEPTNKPSPQTKFPEKNVQSSVPVITLKRAEPVYISSNQIGFTSESTPSEEEARNLPKVIYVTGGVPLSLPPTVKSTKVVRIIKKRLMTVKKFRRVSLNPSTKTPELTSSTDHQLLQHIPGVVKVKRIKIHSDYNVNLPTTTNAAKSPMESSGVISPSALVNPSDNSTDIQEPTPEVPIDSVVTDSPPETVHVTSGPPSKQVDQRIIEVTSRHREPLKFRPILPKITLKHAEPVPILALNPISEIPTDESQTCLPQVSVVAGSVDIASMETDDETGRHLIVSQEELSTQENVNIPTLHPQFDDVSACVDVPSADDDQTGSRIVVSEELSSQENDNGRDIPRQSLQENDVSSIHLADSNLPIRISSVRRRSSINMPIRSVLAGPSSVKDSLYSVSLVDNQSQPECVNSDTDLQVEVPDAEVLSFVPISEEDAHEYPTTEPLFPWHKPGIPSEVWAAGKQPSDLVALCVGVSIWQVDKYLVVSTQAPLPRLLSLWSLKPRMMLVLPTGIETDEASPCRMYSDGNVYQKVSSTPPTYAMLLGVIRNAAACWELVARGAPLQLYCCHSCKLYPLKSEKLDYPPWVSMSGGIEVKDGIIAIQRTLSAVAALSAPVLSTAPTSLTAHSSKTSAPKNPPPVASPVPIRARSCSPNFSLTSRPRSRSSTISAPSPSYIPSPLASRSCSPVTLTSPVSRSSSATMSAPSESCLPSPVPSPTDHVTIACSPVPTVRCSASPVPVSSPRPVSPMPVALPPRCSPSPMPAVSPPPVSSPMPDASPPCSPPSPVPDVSSPVPVTSPVPVYSPLPVASPECDASSRAESPRPLTEASQHELEEDDTIQSICRPIRTLEELEDVCRMSDSHFLATYRLPKHLVLALIQELRPHVPPLEDGDIAPGKKILVCLNFLATGADPDAVAAATAQQVSRSTVCGAITQVLEALGRRSVYRRHVKFPDTPKQRADIKYGFYSKFGLSDVVGALGGVHVPVMAPDQDGYHNGVGHSLNVQIVCDADMRILSVDTSHGGAAPNCAAWAAHPLNTLTRGLVDSGEQVFFVTDATYLPQETTLTPITHPHTANQRLYARLHRAAHRTITRCISILKSRWRCLSHGSETTAAAPELCASLVEACAALHNVALRVPVPVPEDDDTEHSEKEITAQLIASQRDSIERYLRGVNSADRARLMRDMSLGRSARRHVVRELTDDTDPIRRESADLMTPEFESVIEPRIDPRHGNRLMERAVHIRRHSMPETITLDQEETITLEDNVLETRDQNVSETATKDQNVSETETKDQNVSETVTRVQNMTETVTRVQNVSETVTRDQNVTETATQATTTTEGWTVLGSDMGQFIEKLKQRRFERSKLLQELAEYASDEDS